MFCSRLILLSDLWRPHSEQLKCWIAASAKDAEVLSLARNYLQGLDLQNALVTLDDGLELVDILPKIRYPHGSHAISYIAKHFETTSNELTSQNIKQLSADARSADGDLDHYEATLGCTPFFSAFSHCIRSLESVEMVQLALPFCKFVNERGSQTKHVASRILQVIGDELARRLNEGENKAAILIFLAAQNVALETEQWVNLKRAAFVHTVAVDEATLRSLLQLIVTHDTPNPNSAWGSVIQEALVKRGSISNTDVCGVVTNIIRSGCPVATSLIDQVVENFQKLSANDFLRILTAWKEVTLSSCDCEAFTSSSKIRLQACTEARLGRPPNTGFSIDDLVWLYCLSFFAAKKAAAFLKLWFSDAQKAPNVSAKEAALLCKIMISTDEFVPLIVRSVCLHSKSDLLDQEGSIAMLHVYQKAGKRAPQELVKKAVGRLGRRLVTARSQDGKGNVVISSNDLAVLLASLCFVDDEEQLTLLKRLLQFPQLTPAVAMTVLRYTRNIKSKACQFVRAKIVKKLIKFARKFSAKEVCFTMAVLAELQIRDAAAFEHLLRELENKKPSVKDVVAAGRAAKALRLTSTFEQLNVVPYLHELSDVAHADLFTILRCCGMERRRALLSLERVHAIVNNVDVTKIKTSDLLILFSLCVTNVERREAVAKIMSLRAPAMRHEVDVDDVVGAFECAVVAHEIESICRICTNVAQDLSELHLMRLLRCAQGYSSMPNTFYRYVGKVILSLSSDGRLSPNNALLWTKFYCDHQIKDDSVGRCLVARAGRVKFNAPPDLFKALQKAGMLYGVSTKSVKNFTKHQPKADRRIVDDNIFDKAR